MDSKLASRIFVAVLMVGITFCDVPTVAAAGAEGEDLLADVPRIPRAPCLYDFSGAVNVPGGGLWHELGVGWGRHDFSWGAIEVSDDEWRFEKYDRMVLNAHLHGQELLPILDYCAPWAAEEAGAGTGPPRDVELWRDYVETVVARYSRPPFNLRYFQIWNEPTKKAGFWKGETDAEFFEKIYLPAAEIIKRYGCEVVFGGWPVSDGIERFCRLFDRFEAWRVTDILDIHYYGLPSMVELYERYVATGKCDGVWQTEIGFHPFPDYLPNLYCRTLYWGLKHDWSFPHKFKLFWYAFWGAGDDGIKCLTTTKDGEHVATTTHGIRLKTLNEILGGGQLSAFDAYSTDPPLPFTTNEDVQSSQGFMCGDRTVIALQVSPEVREREESVAISAQLPVPPSRVMRYDSVGGRRELNCEYTEGSTDIRVPLADMKAGIARKWGREVRYIIAYVVIEP